MPRKFKFICDACDREAELASRDLPTSWAEVQVEATGFTNWRSGGSKELVRNFLLCPNCQIDFRERVEVTKWPRANQEKAA